MKIGIITYHRAHNYGAYLQACALCNRLNMESDFEAELIDFRMNRESMYYSLNNISWKYRIRHPFRFRLNSIKWRGFQRALESPVMKRSSEFMESDSLEDFRDFIRGKYDVVIAGSDEIWKFTSFRGFPTPYWLIGDIGARKVSYAASSRVSFNRMSQDQYATLVDALNDFEYIGVRDKKTEAAVRDVIQAQEKVHLNCDPSFLYDFDVPRIALESFLQNKARIDPMKKNIVVMVDYDTKQIAEEVRFEYGRAYNLISVFNFHPGYHNIADLTPMEWLTIIRNADLVITTYFHGTCFSIIMGTPFVSLGSTKRSSKLEELFPDHEPLQERYISDPVSFLKSGYVADITKRFMQPYEHLPYVQKMRTGFTPFLDFLRYGK